jgi:hypothetical protein
VSHRAPFSLRSMCCTQSTYGPGSKRTRGLQCTSKQLLSRIREGWCPATNVSHTLTLLPDTIEEGQTQTSSSVFSLFGLTNLASSRSFPLQS